MSPPAQLLLPSATSLVPAAGPWLVLGPSDASLTLESDLGEPVELETVRTFQELSLCGWPFRLVRPKGPLEVGEYYRLAVATQDDSDERRFKATDRLPKTVERLLTVKVRHEIVDGEMNEAGCSHPKLNGLHAKGIFVGSAQTDAPALLFMEFSVADQTFGELSGGAVSLDQGSASRFALSTEARTDLPQLDTSAACARVVVRDALDAVVFDQELCPEPGKSVEKTETVSISEHLVRETSEPEEGCGCRLRRTESPSAGALSLLLLALSARFRRGTRSRNRSASTSTRRSTAATKRSSGRCSSGR